VSSRPIPRDAPTMSQVEFGFVVESSIVITVGCNMSGERCSNICPGNFRLGNTARQEGHVTVGVSFLP